MPIYEYQCEECGHKLEVMQRMSEDPLKTCPSCSEDTLKKLVSKAGFRLTGTGWYETDFKDKGKPEADKDKRTEKEKEGPGDKEGAKDSKKDDTKKDASSDAKKSDSSESSKTSTSTSDD